MGMTERSMFAIGVIVANVPEGLLPTVTLSLALATQRMARRNPLLRRLSAVETLGATTVICTDKTATLTASEMTVRRTWTPEGAFEMDGTGYAPRDPPDRTTRSHAASSPRSPAPSRYATTPSWIRTAGG
jgi:magnesium-transporting ATPase (P-type)